nr:annexin [Hymenolepis microstoma]
MVSSGMGPGAEIPFDVNNEAEALYETMKALNDFEPTLIGTLIKFELHGRIHIVDCIKDFYGEVNQCIYH